MRANTESLACGSWGSSRRAANPLDPVLRLLDWIAQRPRLAALLGAACISFSGIFYRWSEVSPSTGVVFRCLYGLPLLLFVAWFERRELGSMSSRTIRLSALAGVFFAADLLSFHYVVDNIGAGLATVLTELVTNAAKYSPDQVDIEVTAGADTRTVWFRVADRGAGIRPEHVERAFERFWQFDRSDQRRSGGVGLGLYLVRQIVERQNGWVSLRPRDGGGTVAEVRLPRADECAGEAQGAANQG